MTCEPDSGIAQAVLRALTQVSTAKAPAVVGDGTLLHVAGASGLSGDYQGIEAIRGLLKQLADLTDGTFQLTASVARPEIDGLRTVIEGRAEAVRRRKQLSTAVRLVLVVERGGLGEIWLSCQDQREFDDFFG